MAILNRFPKDLNHYSLFHFLPAVLQFSDDVMELGVFNPSSFVSANAVYGI